MPTGNYGMKSIRLYIEIKSKFLLMWIGAGGSFAGTSPQNQLPSISQFPSQTYPSPSGISTPISSYGNLIK